jgi:diguanylate cyclase (GGDEF)-like protein
MANKIRVCVVDDEAALAEVICEGLKATGIHAVPAGSGAEALEICAKGGIDLALLDIAMPGMDGYDVCRRLKANPATKDIVVIFVTGRGEPEDHEIGFALGAADYVTKPFNLPMLMLRVESALRMHRARGPAGPSGDAGADAAYTDQTTGLRNRRFLMERLQEEVDKAHRYNYPVSCVIMDVDGVEALNATAGAAELNDLLAEVAMSIRGYTRSYDVLARYDGTLFVALLPHTELANAIKYGEKIMDDVDASVFSEPACPTKATLSVGVVTFQNGTATAADLVFGEAMRTLLKAKSLPKPHRIFGRQLDKAR